MISYELAKKLIDAGFKADALGSCPECGVMAPTLSELIEACGEGFLKLQRCYKTQERDELSGWEAYSKDTLRFSLTPEEAVANLWLELNKK